eukprot:2524896-Prorocentrum_lima.AAC.1
MILPEPLAGLLAGAPISSKAFAHLSQCRPHLVHPLSACAAAKKLRRTECRPVSPGSKCRRTKRR